MCIEAVWDRVGRYGWKVVEVAAWRWTAREADAGRAGRVYWIEAELVARGVEGLEVMWEVGMLDDDDVAAIVALVDDRNGRKNAPALAA